MKPLDSQPPNPPADAEFRVCLLGASTSTGNRGVSALSTSLMLLLTEARPNVRITLLAAQPRPQVQSMIIAGKPTPVRVFNYRLSPKAPLREQLVWIVLLAALYRLCPWKTARARLAAGNPWIGALAEADLVGDIRGGDSFSDIYGLKRFLTGALVVRTALWVHGSLVLLPQTHGPFASRTARHIARRILRRASTVLARDEASLAEVDRVTSGTVRARFCPDVAFALDPRRPATLQIEPPLPDEPPPLLVGLNVNGLMYRGGYTRANMFGLKLDYREFLRRLVETLVADHGARVLLVPHTFAPPESVESDPQASAELLAALPPAVASRVHRVHHPYDQHELKWIIGRCDFFVGSRMHACIAALSQGIPAVGIAYSRKFQGVFDSVGMHQWIVDGRTADSASAVARVLELLDRRHEAREPLAQAAQLARSQLAATFADLTRRPKDAATASTPVTQPQESFSSPH